MANLHDVMRRWMWATAGMIAVLSPAAVAQNDRVSGRADSTFLRASDVLKLRVEAAGGAAVGEVRNLAIDTERGRVRYVIASAAQRDDKLIPVPWQALRFNQAQKTARIEANQRRLEDAPPFDPQGWNTIDNSDWGRKVYEFYGLQPYWTNQKPTDADGNPIVRGQELLRMRIETPRGNDLARMDDLIIDERTGRIAYAIASPEEGRDHKLVAIPWRQIQFNARPNALVIDMDRQKLNAAPGFSANNWPRFNDANFHQRVHAYYGADPGWVYGTAEPEDDRGRGWGEADEYTRAFDQAKLERYDGRVMRIESFTPAQGKDEGLRMRLQTDNDRTLNVVLGPAWFIRNQHLQLREGENVRVAGAPAEIGGERVVIATHVRMGDQVLGLRYRDGSPIWVAWRSVNQRDDDNQPRPFERMREIYGDDRKRD